MNIDHNSNTPLHIQAEEILRNLIDSEEYKDGKYLPNEIELSQKLNISRNTLRQAINKLVFEGLLVRKKGVGTKIAHKSIIGGVKNWLSFSVQVWLTPEEAEKLLRDAHLLEEAERGNLQLLRHRPEAAGQVHSPGTCTRKKGISVRLFHILFQSEDSAHRRRGLHTAII